MLPFRVLLEKTMSDPSSRTRLIGTVLAMILLIGAFSTGLSINIQFGRSDDESLPLGLRAAIDPDTGEQVLVDESGQIVDDPTLDGLDLSASAGTPSTGTSGPSASAGSGKVTGAAQGGEGGGTPRPPRPPAVETRAPVRRSAPPTRGSPPRPSSSACSSPT